MLFRSWAASGFYRVQPDEQGVVWRFGEYVRTEQPGLRYHIPAPIETVFRPKVTRVNRVEVGFRSSDGRRQGGEAHGDAGGEALQGHGGIPVRWRDQSCASFCSI